MFILLDTETMAEEALMHIHGPSKTVFTGRDFLQKLSGNEIENIIETCLFTTSGCSILKVVFDGRGDLVSRDVLEERDQF